MQFTTKRALVAVIVLIVLLALAVVFVLHSFRSQQQPTSSTKTISITVVAPSRTADVLSLLPAGAPVIAFADVATLRASAFAADVQALAPSSDEDKDYREFVRDTGFDYSRDLERFAVDAWIDANNRLPDGSLRVTLITIADGKFDRAKISAYALHSGGKTTKRGDIDVYEVPSNVPGQKITFAFLSPTRIALAQGVSLDPVLAKGQSGSLDAATRDRISHVNGSTIFAVARTDDLAKIVSIPGIQSGQLNKILNSIRGLSLSGKPEGSKLSAVVQADCDSMTNAFQLMALLDMLRVLGRAALADPKTKEQMRPGDAEALDTMLKIASVSRDSRTVRIRADIPADILKTPAHPARAAAKP
jgi:hypothetical protein